MKSKKLRQIIVGLLLMVTVSTIGAVTAKDNKNTTPQTVYHQEYILEDNKEVLEAATVLDSLKELNTMNVYGYSGSKTIKLTDGNFLTKRSQEVKFYFSTGYILDMSALTLDNVKVNQSTNEITIYSKPLELDEITFNEDKTVISEVSKAEWYTLSKSNIELTMAELEQIKAQIKENIKIDILSDTELLKAAEESAVKNINNNIRLLTGNGQWNLSIKFIK